MTLFALQYLLERCSDMKQDMEARLAEEGAQVAYEMDQQLADAEVADEMDQLVNRLSRKLDLDQLRELVAELQAELTRQETKLLNNGS